MKGNLLDIRMPRLPHCFQVPQLIGFPGQLALLAEGSGVQEMNDVGKDSRVYVVIMPPSIVKATYCDFEKSPGDGP
jgi:hypothetical protein